MLKTRSYLLIAFFVYTITLLSALPASLVITPVSEQIGDSVQVSSVSGTVWKGRVVGEYNYQDFDLTWDLHLWKLFLLNIAADVHLKSSLFEIKTDLALAYKSIKINALSGVIKASSLNALLIQENLQVEVGSDIFLQKINLKRADATFKEASGQIGWDGGEVKVKELPGGKIKLPPLLAIMTLEDKGILVSVVLKEQANAQLLSVDLSHEGQAHLKLKERVAEYVDVPKQLQTGNPDNIMFEIKRQIFETQGKF